MPRRKISEYRSKKIVNQALGLGYIGWEVINGKVPSGVPVNEKLVVKVDQAVKQRFKRGLIYLDITAKSLPNKVRALTNKGFYYLLIEPYFTHNTDQERYISLRRERRGIMLSYSRYGGVEIESKKESIISGFVGEINLDNIARDTGLTIEQLHSLIETFNSQHMTLLEINPYVVENGGPKVLDVAVEVDSAADLLVDGWSEFDYRSPPTHITDEENIVKRLNNESPASFNLEVINPDGSIFLLLSGGGASIVVADEIFIKGYGKQLANYGEYSGNPNSDETQVYAEQVIKLLLKSKSKNKVVFIGGAVANFTDIKNTFEGIINVIKKYGKRLQKQDIKFYVRRGGPRQTEGLKAMKRALEEHDILGGVYNPSTSIPVAVASLVEGLRK